MSTIEIKLQQSIGGSEADTATIITAGRVATFMDSSVDPCDNFYKFSCNGYIASNFIPNLQSGDSSIFAQLAAQRSNELLRILYGERESSLKSVFANDAGYEPVYRQMLSYFQVCNNSVPYTSANSSPQDANSLANYTTVKSAYIANMTQYVSTNMSVDPTQDDLAYVKLHASLSTLDPNVILQVRGMQTGLPTWIVQPEALIDPNNKNSVILTFGPTMLGAGYQLDDSLLPQYSYFLFEVLSTYLYKSTDPMTVNNLANAMASFELSMWKLMTAYPALSQDKWLKVNMATMETMYPYLVSVSGNYTGKGWHKYFVAIGIPVATPGTVNIEIGIYISSPQYYAALNTLFQNTSPHTIAEYAKFIALGHVGVIGQLHGFLIDGLYYTGLNIGFTSQTVSRFRKGFVANQRKTVREYLNPVRPGFDATFQSRLEALKSENLILDQDISSQAQILITEQCVADTMEQFPLVLGRAYYELVLSQYTRSSVRQLVFNIQNAYANRMNNPNTEPWLDAVSRAAAIQKLKAINLMILLPDEGLDGGYMGRFYQDIVAATPQQSLLNNFLAATYQVNRVQMRYWTMDPEQLQFLATQDWTTVNAFYEQTTNRLILPMGLIHPMFVNPKSSLAMSYGVIGSIIGHELTHAFDTQGVKYDANGNPTNLFDYSSDQKFQSLTKCYSTFFDGYSYLNVSINGDRTLAENIADNGGLHVSWDAYQYEATGMSPSTLPGLSSYTQDQLFWMGYGQVWCSSSVQTLQALLQAQDVHTIASVRVNAGLALNDAFRSTWNCPVGSAMAPAKECSLWK